MFDIQSEIQKASEVGKRIDKSFKAFDDFAAKADPEVHGILMQCLFHAAMYGDVTLIERYVNGLEGRITDNKFAAIRLWIVWHSPITSRRDATGAQVWKLIDAKGTGRAKLIERHGADIYGSGGRGFGLEAAKENPFYSAAFLQPEKVDRVNFTNTLSLIKRVEGIGDIFSKMKEEDDKGRVKFVGDDQLAARFVAHILASVKEFKMNNANAAALSIEPALLDQAKEAQKAQPEVTTAKEPEGDTINVNQLRPSITEGLEGEAA